MEKTGFHADLLKVDLGGQVAAPARRGKPHLWLFKAFKLLASLRITVVLFFLSILLVFFGTLAQVDAGIWTVVHKYFRSAFVHVPWQIFFPRNFQVPGGFPFPGGWLLGGLLLVNLLAAHAFRFKIFWRKPGLLLIHSGLVVLMLSEVITGKLAVESRMTIANGEAVNFLDHSRQVELAIIDSSQPGTDEVVVIPEALLQTGGLIRNHLLPFDVEVEKYVSNSHLLESSVPVRGGDKPYLNGSDGKYYALAERSEESGADPNQRDDAAAVWVRFKGKGSDKVLASHALSLWFYPNFTNRAVRFPPHTVLLDGKSYRVELRPKRIYTPFTLQLLEFRHDRFLGTDTPKNFSSRLRLLDPARNEDREVKIYMNNPLRYGGETFYQSGYLPDDAGTILQVVRNVGWLLPYVSCLMVGIGMLVHFSLNLVKFLHKRLAA